MKFQLSFFRDINFLRISLVTILLNLIVWILVFFFLKKGNFNIILHYSVLFGVDLKGDPEQALIIPFIGLVIFFLNAVIAKLIYKNQKFIVYLFLSTSLVCQIFAAIAIVAIILINTIGLQA